MFGAIGESYRSRSLAQRYMLASLVVLALSTATIGWWVGQQIELGVVNRTAATTALYVDSFVAPHLQAYGGIGTLASAEAASLEALVNETAFGRRIVSFKVWEPTGRVLYSTDSATTGEAFPLSDRLTRAFQGEVVSGLSDLRSEENVVERTRFSHLIESYSPVFLAGTSQVIAVVRVLPDGRRAPGGDHRGPGAKLARRRRRDAPDLPSPQWDRSAWKQYHRPPAGQARWTSDEPDQPDAPERAAERSSPTGGGPNHRPQRALPPPSRLGAPRRPRPGACLRLAPPRRVASLPGTSATHDPPLPRRGERHAGQGLAAWGARGGQNDGDWPSPARSSRRRTFERPSSRWYDFTRRRPEPGWSYIWSPFPNRSRSRSRSHSTG